MGYTLVAIKRECLITYSVCLTPPDRCNVYRLNRVVRNNTRRPRNHHAAEKRKRVVEFSEDVAIGCENRIRRQDQNLEPVRPEQRASTALYAGRYAFKDEECKSPSTTPTTPRQMYAHRGKFSYERGSQPDTSDKIFSTSDLKTVASPGTPPPFSAAQ